MMTFETLDNGEIRDLTGRDCSYGRVYPLSHTAFAEQKSRGEYTGCGNGYVIVDKADDVVVEMSYASDGINLEREQNIAMSANAGQVIWETDSTVCYRANFSCWEACLF